MRKLMLFGGLLALAASPAFAQFEGGVNGAGGAGEIKEKDRATLIRSTFVARRAIQIWIARFSTAIAASFTASDIVGCA